MTLSYGGITYTEYKTSKTGTIAANQTASAKKVFDVAAADYWNFMYAVLGASTPDGNGGVIFTPAMPYEKGSPLYAGECNWAGVAEDNHADADGSMLFKKMRITVTFGPLKNALQQQNPTSTPWEEESSNFKADVMQLPGYAVNWSDGTPVESPCGIVVVTSDVNLTRYNVPANWNRAGAIAAAGTVNSTSFMNYAAGTLLFCGFSPKRTISVVPTTQGSAPVIWQPPGGSAPGKLKLTGSQYTVTIGLKWKPTGWNNLWRPNVGWTYVVAPGNISATNPVGLIYHPYEFNGLTF
jgi:hypothetical protein